MKLTIKGATATVSGTAAEYVRATKIVDKLARVYRRANTGVELDRENGKVSFVFEKLFGTSASDIRRAYVKAKAEV